MSLHSWRFLCTCRSLLLMQTSSIDRTCLVCFSKMHCAKEPPRQGAKSPPHAWFGLQNAPQDSWPVWQILIMLTSCVSRSAFSTCTRNNLQMLLLFGLMLALEDLFCIVCSRLKGHMYMRVLTTQPTPELSKLRTTLHKTGQVCSYVLLLACRLWQPMV